MSFSEAVLCLTSFSIFVAYSQNIAKNATGRHRCASARTVRAAKMSGTPTVGVSSHLRMRATVAVARKLLELCYHILKSGKPYSESIPEKHEAKLRKLEGKAKVREAA